MILLLHTSLIIAQCLFWNLGAWNNLVVVLSLTPYFVAYVVVKRKDEMDRLDLIFAEPREWNTEKSLEEYMRMISMGDETGG